MARDSENLGSGTLLLVFYLTLVEMAFGLGLTLCFVGPAALGLGYGKTISAIAFFCLLGPVLFAARMLPVHSMAVLVGIRASGIVSLALWFAYFLVLNFSKREKAQRTLYVLILLSQTALVALTASGLARRFFSPGSHDPYGPSIPALMLMLLAGLASSGLLLGSVTAAMLVGHWYLVIPELSIKWLKGACWIFVAALGARAVSILLSLGIGVLTAPFGVVAFVEDRLAPSSMLIAARLVVGLLLPAGMGVLAYKAASIRATQSATGILFPAIIVILIGEMIASSLMIGLSGLCI